MPSTRPGNPNQPFLLEKFSPSPDVFTYLCQEGLRSGKAVRLLATGDSMVPIIRQGDMLLITPLAGGAIRVGDVVFFADKHGRMVLHRVIRIRQHESGHRFLLQADNSIQADGWISLEAIYGRLASFERTGEHFSMSRSSMRLLSLWMVFNLRHQLNRYNHLRLTNRPLKCVPGFCKYLS